MKKKNQSFYVKVLISITYSILLVNCMNKEYDLNEIDWTLGFGSDKLTLPGNNSTAEILLDDIFSIDGTDIISTRENGDYILSENPSPVAHTKVTIDPISITDAYFYKDSIKVSLPEEYIPFSGTTIDISNNNICASGKIASFEYKYDVPEAVKALEYVDVANDDDGCEFAVSLSVPQPIISFDYLEIDLPNLLQMTWENPIEGGIFDTNTNRLRLTHFQPGHQFTLRFKVTRIFSGHTNNENFVDFKEGHIMIKGTIFADMKIAKIIIPTEEIGQVSGSISIEDINIVRVHGVFDPEIKMEEIGVVTINETPAFLLHDEVILDLDNPQIWLRIHSTMPLGGTVKAVIRSDVYPEGITLDTPGRMIQIKGSHDGYTETETRILLCRHNPGVNTKDYQVIEDDNLSKLISKMYNGMKLEFIAKEVKANQDTCTVESGREYYLNPYYQFIAPLAFGANAIIAYHNTFKDWHKEIEKLALSKESFVHLTATAVNKIPADLELSAVPIDKDGQSLNELKVELIKKIAKGSKESATESPIEIMITDTTGKGLSKLDGITISLIALSNEQLRGITLNKTTQTLVIKDIRIELVGKVIYDAN